MRVEDEVAAERARARARDAEAIVVEVVVGGVLLLLQDSTHTSMDGGRSVADLIDKASTFKQGCSAGI